MKYMFLIYGAEDAWTEDERKACVNESLGICDELAAQGKLLDVSPLELVATAASVRVRDGQTLVTDGPFVETTEQLGGYFVLDLADLDEAITVAARLPPAKKGTVEIRPLVALGGVPPARPVSSVTDGGSLTPFLLLCCHDEAALESVGPQVVGEAMAESAAQCRRLAEEGRYLSSSPLHPAATATCVRVRGGQRLLTDGPFAETNEVVGGYFLILAEDRRAAVRIAAQLPGARFGTIEVRPLFDLSRFRKSS
jgi:hypothetical protein